MRRPRTYLLFNILGLMLKHLSSSPALAFAPPAIRTASAATFPQTIRDPILRPLAQSTLRCSGSPASGRRDLAPQVGRGLAVHGFGAHTNLARVPVLSGVWSARRAVASPASLHQGKSDTTEAPPFQAQIGTNGTRKGFSIAHVLQLPAELPTAKEVEAVSEKLLREVTEEGMGLALALHLCCAERYPTISAARNALRKGKVLTPDMAELDTTARVRGGEVFLVQHRSQPGHAPVGEKPFDMDVIFEDDHLAIFVKPQGVMTHRHRPSGQSATVKSGLAYVLAPTRAEGALFRPVPCHRLDMGTGGLMVAAKTSNAVSSIHEQFRDRLVDKEYTAIVAGKMEQEASVDLALSGLEAQTRFSPRESMRSLKYGWVTKVVCYPLTGRKHQIRRHLLHLAHPIIGDARYTGLSVGHPEWTPEEDCGLMLWASRLALSHPVDARRMTFESEPPAKFGSFLTQEEDRFRKLVNEGHAE